MKTVEFCSVMGFIVVAEKTAKALNQLGKKSHEVKIAIGKNRVFVLVSCCPTFQSHEMFLRLNYAVFLSFAT